MKTLKSIWVMFPLHYWTGIIAGVIYAIWVGVSFYTREQNILEHSFPVGWIILAFASFPRFLHVNIVDPLMDWIPYNPNWETIYDTIYQYSGYILSGIGFVLLGIIFGKTSNDLQRDARRRRIIMVLSSVVIFTWVCFACMLALISN